MRLQQPLLVAALAFALGTSAFAQSAPVADLDTPAQTAPALVPAASVPQVEPEVVSTPAVKMLEDFVISPKIIGDRSGLHPLTIILAVMIGAKLMGGFLGALLAVPLTAVLRTLMFRYVWKKRPRKSKVAEPREAADIAS